MNVLERDVNRLCLFLDDLPPYHRSVFSAVGHHPRVAFPARQMLFERQYGCLLL